jgi:DNA-binding NtrC family response regulator
VVEDDPAVRKLCIGALRKQGHRTLEAFDGEMGLAFFQRHQEQIDLVLTDVVMPYSGVEMAEKLLRIAPDMTVLFMTGAPVLSEVTEHVKYCRILEKPFGIERLLRTVQECLRSEGQELFPS